MVTYHAPGAYFEVADRAPAGVAPIRTDVAAFVGLAERGPLDVPVRVESWEQFQAAFGGFVPYAYLAYAVKAFFENGGRTCWVVRAAAPDAAAARALLPDAGGTPALAVEASGPGVWGDGLAVRIARSHPAATITAARTQRPEGTSLFVDSVAGFEAGALVRIVQHGPGGPLVEHRFVAVADAARNLLGWDVPLPGAFDPERGASLETLEFTVAVAERGRVRESATGLSLHPDHPRFAGGPLDDLRLVTLGAAGGGWPDVADAAAVAARLPAAGPFVTLAGGRDGLAALRVEDLTGVAGAPARRGLRALEPVDEVAIVAVPDAHVRPAPPVEYAPLPEPEPDPCCPPPEPPELMAVPLPPPSVTEQPPAFTHEEIACVQLAAVEHCEALRDRVAVLDAPVGLDTGAVMSWRRRFNTSWAALYYPWLAVVDPLQRGVAPVRFVPPSGHVAGVYAHGDRTVGVHRAPANLGLRWAQGTDVEVDAPAQAGLNPAGVNCLRVAEARGLQVYGARTLSSDASLRFVNVRRLLAMIAESLLASLQWTVFEPHDEQLRLLVRLATSSFLRGLWAAGALAGNQPEEAFFVRCDDTTNPPEVVDAGQLRCDVGVAPSIPAEFVVVRIGRVDNEWLVLG